MTPAAAEDRLLPFIRNFMLVLAVRKTKATVGKQSFAENRCRVHAHALTLVLRFAYCYVK
jgi:hypothetical protein